MNRTLIQNNMVNALERKLKFPELIAGFDLVQQEDLGHPLVDFAPELIFFQRERLKFFSLNSQELDLSAELLQPEPGFPHVTPRRCWESRLESFRTTQFLDKVATAGL